MISISTEGIRLLTQRGHFYSYRIFLSTSQSYHPILLQAQNMCKLHSLTFSYSYRSIISLTFSNSYWYRISLIFTILPFQNLYSIEFLSPSETNLLTLLITQIFSYLHNLTFPISILNPVSLTFSVLIYSYQYRISQNSVLPLYYTEFLLPSQPYLLTL